MLALECEVVQGQIDPVQVEATQDPVAHVKDLGQGDYIAIPDEPPPPARGWVFLAPQESC